MTVYTDITRAKRQESLLRTRSEELSDKYSVATLREKFESVIGDVSEELSASSEQAQPRSQDPSEEELSSQSDGSTEELEESVQERQEQIREKILSN